MTESTPPAGDPAPPAPAGDTPTPNDPGQAPRTDGPQDVATLTRLLAEARGEAAKARTTAKAQAADHARTQLAQEIGKAIGLVQDGDGKPDPEALTRQLAQQADAARLLQVENAALRAAGQHGADPAALLDSREFMAKAGKLDPTSDQFSTLLDAAIKEAVEGNPRFRTTGPAPARGGGQFNGGPGATPRITTLNEAIAARLAGG